MILIMKIRHGGGLQRGADGRGDEAPLHAGWRSTALLMAGSSLMIYR